MEDNVIIVSTETAFGHIELQMPDQSDPSDAAKKMIGWFIRTADAMLDLEDAKDGQGSKQPAPAAKTARTEEQSA